MTGEVMFAGGEADSIVVVSGTVTEVNGGGYDATYSRCSLQVPNTGTVMRATCYDSNSDPASISAPDTAFIHNRRTIAGSGIGTGDVTVACDTAGHGWVKIASTSGTLRVYGNTGTGASPSWTELGNTGGFIANNAYTDDLRIQIGLDGVHTVEFSIDQNQMVLATFTNTDFTEIRSVTYSATTSFVLYFSQLLITKNQSTIGAHVYTSVLDGNGFYTDWTGAYTDINETPLNDSNSIQTAVSDQVWTGTTGDVSLPAGYIIPTVFVWSRSKYSGSAPTNIQCALYINSTLYPSANLAGIGVSYVNLPKRWDLNPNGDIAWTAGAWNATQRGVKSIA